MADWSPDVAELRSLVSTITTSIDLYESNVDPLQQSINLSNIAQASQRIKNACTPAADAFADFTFQPMANACVRIALSMSLFDHVPKAGGICVEDLAKLCNADIDLTNRITRGLVALNVTRLDDGSGLLSHTQTSLIYTDPARRSWAIWMWDVMAQAATTGVGPFFDGKSHQSRTMRTTASLRLAWGD